MALIRFLHRFGSTCVIIVSGISFLSALSKSTPKVSMFAKHLSQNWYIPGSYSSIGSPHHRHFIQGTPLQWSQLSCDRGEQVNAHYLNQPVSPFFLQPFVLSDQQNREIENCDGDLVLPAKPCVPKLVVVSPHKFVLLSRAGCSQLPPESCLPSSPALCPCPHKM